MNKRIIIADILTNTINGKQTGHYFALARNYLELFGERCLVAGGPVYKNAFQENELFVLPNNNVEGDGMIKLRLRTFENAHRLFKEAKGDVIVLQQCTTITSFLCVLLFYHKKSKLLFIQYNQSGLRQQIGRFLYSLVKNKIDGIICPNDEVGKAYGIPYCVVPDYIYAGADIIGTIPYKKKKYDFCIVGRISEEKGIIEVAKQLKNSHFKLLIAGRPTNELLKGKLLQICNDATNIELILDFISEDQYKQYLSESRYTILNYQGEYSKRSSGVVYDTLFAGVPVVGCRCKALQFIEDNGVGYLYDSIGEFNFNSVLDELKYKELIESIKAYRQGHKDYKEKLMSFLFN